MIAVAALGGWADRPSTAVEGHGAKQPAAKQPAADEVVLAEHRFLNLDDFGHFQAGADIDDVLDKIERRGNFEMAAVLDGRNVVAVSFASSREPVTPQTVRSSLTEALIVWALFVDDKFVKFVDWPAWKMDEIVVDGTKASRYAPLPLGNFDRLKTALAQPAIDIAERRRKLLREPPPRRSFDPGLTAVWLFLPKPRGAADPVAYRSNAQLRRQFNAERLRLGMTPTEAANALKSKALETGETPAGRYEIYGSRESFEILFSLHYSNILVLFRDAKAVGIYAGETFPGGSPGIDQIRELFVDLPKP